MSITTVCWQIICNAHNHSQPSRSKTQGGKPHFRGSFESERVTSPLPSHCAHPLRPGTDRIPEGTEESATQTRCHRWVAKQGDGMGKGTAKQRAYFSREEQKRRDRVAPRADNLATSRCLPSNYDSEHNRKLSYRVYQKPGRAGARCASQRRCPQTTASATLSVCLFMYESSVSRAMCCCVVFLSFDARVCGS